MSKLIRPIHLGIAALCMVFACALSPAAVLQRQSTIVDLVRQSELILRGTVTNLTDGIDDRGMPYTEVTLHVAETIRGQVGSDYTFRQFGLLKPRSMGNGLVNVMVTPAGWPTFRKGEENILFLNKPAKFTGLQTTVGLGHGQFRVAMGGATNLADNSGLFSGVTVDATQLEASERRVINTGHGAVNSRSFVSLVHKIVDGRWIELGSMHNATH